MKRRTKTRVFLIMLMVWSGLSAIGFWDGQWIMGGLSLCVCVALMMQPELLVVFLLFAAPARADVFTAAAIAGAAGDIVTTEVALSRGYVEQNVGYRPLRIGANALITGACLVAAHEVGKSGHRGWATALKLVPAVVFGGLAVKNARTMQGGLR